MDGLNNSAAVRITNKPWQGKVTEDKGSNYKSQRKSTSPISCRKCNSVGASLVEAGNRLPDLPAVHLTETFYQPKNNQPITYGEKLSLTHRFVREVLSKYMDVYAVITDDVTGDGGNNILVFGKPKFTVNDLSGSFSTSVFGSVGQMDKSPFSSDLFGFSLLSEYWMLNNFYEMLTTKCRNNERIYRTEKIIYEKLQVMFEPQRTSYQMPVADDGLLKISRMEAEFIFEKSLGAAINEIKEMRGRNHYKNHLDSKATINDLPEILSFYRDGTARGRYDAWKLNYLDQALLSNATWE